MKNAKWLDVTEYALLAGSGVGSIAAIATQQLAYSAAPVSFLMVLNLINRHRLDQQVHDRTTQSITQVDQRLSKQMDTLDRRIQSLPTFWDLANLRKTLMQKNRTNLNQLHSQLSHRIERLESENVGQMKHEVHDLQTQQARIAESIERITANLRRTATIDQVREHETAIGQIRSSVESLQSNLGEVTKVYRPSTLKMLQGQIDYLNRRFNTLPNPIDAASLKQDVDGLLQLVGDLVPRRELVRLLGELEHIRREQHCLNESIAPLRVTSKILRQQVTHLTQTIQRNEEQAQQLQAENPHYAQAFAELKTSVAALQQQLDQAPADADLLHLQGQIDHILHQLEPLQHELNGLNHLTETLEQQQTHLYSWINRLPEMLDFAALRNQLKYLAARLDLQETQLNSLSTQQTELAHSLTTPSIGDRASDYELVFDLKPYQDDEATQSNSRTLVEAALAEASDRLILVFPYPDRATFDAGLLQQFRAFLDRGGRLDLGWGYLGDVQQSQLPRYIHQRPTANPSDKSFLQGILSQLTQLKRKYPKQFYFKVLGTDENFLVCDDRYALLGFYPIATRSVVFPKVAVGLRTTATEVIQALVDRFENPVLTENDADAYFHRAVTRHELDDKQGAIADYTQVIQINPNHDVAYNNRGLIRYELGNKEGAIADLNRALSINPCNSLAFCNRGVIRAELGNPMGAIEDYSYAIHADLGCTPAYFQRGLARFQMGNKMGAVEDFSEVIELNNQDASAFFYRGMARTKLGDRIGAIRDLKDAARLFNAQGNHNSYQQAMTAITQLQKSLVIDGNGEGIAKSG